MSEAEQDRVDIYDYIAVDNPRAAGHMSALFGKAASRLADFTYMGKTGPFPGTRELIVHRQYRLVYQVDIDTETVWILALIHGARDWPPTS